MPRLILAAIALMLVFAAAPRAAAADDPFAGTWRGFAATNGMQCQFDLVMTAAGRYFETARCGPYATSQSGRYRVFSNGTLSRVVTTWSPTQHLVVDATPGSSHYEPTSRPPGGTYQYRFTTPDTMVWRDVNFGGTLTFRRRT